MINNSKITRSGNCGIGSVGGFFTFPSSSTIYGISNNHVVANLNSCAVGDTITDAFNNPIGKLTNWFILNSPGQVNYLDAALFELTPGPPPISWQMNGDVTKPKGFIEPRTNGGVYMITPRGTQMGVITQTYTNQLMNFQLCNQPFLFTHITEIAPKQKAPFSIPGESGCIVFSSNQCIVGLIIGTNLDGSRSYAIPFVDGILKYYPLIIA